MSNLARLLLFVSAGWCCIACGSESSEPEDLSRVKSESGAYFGRFTPEPNPPVTGDNALGVRIEDTKGVGVENAVLGIEPFMLAHGHGVSTLPVVSELGGGDYHAEKIHLMMPGTWQLRVNLDVAEIHDRIVVEYEVK